MAVNGTLSLSDGGSTALESVSRRTGFGNAYFLLWCARCEVLIISFALLSFSISSLKEFLGVAELEKVTVGGLCD